MNRILLIAAVVVSVATAVLGYVNKGKLDATKQELGVAETSLASEQKAHGTTKTALTEANTNLEAMSADKTKVEENLKTVQNDLEDTKTKLADAQKLMEDKAKETEEAQQALAALKKEMEEMDTSKSGAEPTDGGQQVATPQPQENLQEKLQQAEERITNLQAELVTAKAQVDTFQEANRAREALKALNDVQGLVTAVNKPWNFVVLNLGDRQGVSRGSEMLIQRGSNFIGRVRVRSVNPADSVADIDVASIPRGVEIQPGDKVIFRSVERR